MGIGLRRKAGKVTVIGFWKGSPAEQSGIRIGDEVLELNSRPIGFYPQGTLDSLFNDDSLNTFEFLVKSGEGTKRIELKNQFLLPGISE